MPRKLRVGVLCGGRSNEHEISLLSALSIAAALDKKKYDVTLIGIDKKGNWLLENGSHFIQNPTSPKRISLDKNASQVVPLAAPRGTSLISPTTGKVLGTIDVFFPITHGTYGEDGCLQGMLELLGAPYVGAKVVGSAVGMDKDVMKRLLRDAGLPIGKFFAFTRAALTKKNLAAAVQKLGFPLFIKPANAGSSVGVSKVRTRAGLVRAIKEAFKFDKKILLEEFIKGREIEVAVLGSENPRASLPGEIIPRHDFYSYEAKYLDENGAATVAPAALTKKEIMAVQKLAIAAFQTLECRGMGRVDFFLTRTGKWYLNEINTLPGFTKISMYPKLWAVSGFPYPKLLDALIYDALI